MFDLDNESQRKSIEECYKFAKILAMVFLVVLPAVVLFAFFVLMCTDFEVYGVIFFSVLISFGLSFLVYVFVKKHLIVKYGMYKNILEIREETPKKK